MNWFRALRERFRADKSGQSVTALAGSLAVGGGIANSHIQIGLDEEKTVHLFEEAQRPIIECIKTLTEQNNVAERSETQLGHTRELEEQHLRQIAQELLVAGTPPSLLPLFPNSSHSVWNALDKLAHLRRTASDVVPNHPRIARITELSEIEDLHHLLVAPPGSGKTHALWHAAHEMLNNGGLIPLFIPLGGLATWDDAIQTLADIFSEADATEIFRDARICVILDGWSEFASGEGTNERVRAMRILNHTRVIANARRGAIADTIFRVWELDPVPLSTVRGTIKEALPGAPLPDTALLKLLRLPLALSLFVLLGGSAVTRGELLAHLHAHLSNDLPELFSEIIAGAVASMSLSGERSYIRLQKEIRDRANHASIVEPSKILARLGTLENRAGTVLPVHDLYWSWLCGLGLLSENRVEQSLLNLSTRESYQLALESGVRTRASMVSAACEIDVIFAALLWTGLDVPLPKESAFLQLVGNMLSDDRLPVRCRAAIAALHSRQVDLLLPALSVMTEVLSVPLYLPAFSAALTPENLFPNRGIIAEWLGAAGTYEFIDAIATRGGVEWGPWLEQLAHSGKLAPSVAAAAAIACEGRVPPWTVEHLPRLVNNHSWDLRAAANRGSNIELARWVADNYDENVDTGNSRWIELNKVLVSCGDVETFKHLLSRFSSFTKKAQETLGFAIVELGDPWVAQFQMVAFRSSGTIHHHKLAEAISLDIDDMTARHWMANGYFELGWRILIARHGATIVPEMVENLPESFDGLHDIPALAAMRFLVSPPDSLVDEIWRRVRGTMQPKATQDVINALARIRPTGILSIVERIAQIPEFLPHYHLKQFLRLLKAWEDEAGLHVMMQANSGSISFGEWVLFSRLAKEKDNSFFLDVVATDSALAIRAVLNEFRQDNNATVKLLGMMEPLLGYHAELFDHLIVNSDLFSLIPKIFSRAFDTFPEEALLRAIDVSGDKFSELVRGLAVSSTPAHGKLHKEIVRIILSKGTNLFLFRDVAKILRVHPRRQLIELLKSVMSGVVSTELWLLREIEEERHEILINERGDWLE